MIPDHKQFEYAQRHVAEQALEGLSDKAKVRHCFQVITGIQDPDAVVALGSVSTHAATVAEKLSLQEKAGTA